MTNQRRKEMDVPRPRLTYANLMSTVAVFLALGGVSYAAVTIPKDSVGTKQIKNRAVTKPKLDPTSPVLAGRKDRSAGPSRRSGAGGNQRPTARTARRGRVILTSLAMPI